MTSSIIPTKFGIVAIRVREKKNLRKGANHFLFSLLPILIMEMVDHN